MSGKNNLFNDLEKSWYYYVLLESFTDGFGAWQPQAVLGKPIVSLDEWLIEDLTEWRKIGSRFKKQRDKKKAKTNA